VVGVIVSAVAAPSLTLNSLHVLFVLLGVLGVLHQVPRQVDAGPPAPLAASTAAALLAGSGVHQRELRVGREHQVEVDALLAALAQGADENLLLPYLAADGHTLVGGRIDAQGRLRGAGSLKLGCDGSWVQCRPVISPFLCVLGASRERGGLVSVLEPQHPLSSVTQGGRRKPARERRRRGGRTERSTLRHSLYS